MQHCSQWELKEKKLKEIEEHAKEKKWGQNKPMLDIASSLSWQDEPKPGLWLATRVCKVAFGIARCVSQENSALFPHDKSFTEQACSVKIAEY